MMQLNSVLQNAVQVADPHRFFLVKSLYGTQFPRLYLAMAESVSLCLLSQGVLQKLMALQVPGGKQAEQVV